MRWLVLVIYQLILSEITVSSVKASSRVKRTIVGRYPVCPQGCTSCSPVNGCVTCEARYFMFLYRQNMRQIGICTPSCPVGYYGVRHQYYSKCNRCHIQHCEACFSRHYCTRCRAPYLAFRGECIEHCPDGLYYANYSKDCRQRVDCMVGPWTLWNACTQDGRACTSRNGVQTRTRQILESPSPNGSICPSLQETRCRISRRRCNGQCKRRKRHRRKKRKKRKKGKGRKRRKKSQKRGRRKDRKRSQKDKKNRPKEKKKRQRKNRRRRLCRERRCFKRKRCFKRRSKS